jgi:thioredoxin reductase (NADPH)
LQGGKVLVGQGGAGPLETNVPGVFAAGDVRVGSIGRVATSAGEGGAAVSFVHEYLKGLGGP